MYNNLFSSANIGKLFLKNRVIMPAMGTLLTGPDGEINEDVIAYYTERARGGVGLIIVEVTAIDYVHGKGGPTAPRVDDSKFIPGWQRLAESVHPFGAKIFAQLQHPGNQTTSYMNSGNYIVSPSGVRSFAEPEEIPHILTTDEIKSLIKQFIDGAVLLQSAGLDGVEIHGAHGYLINQFFSEYTNMRTDEYGGSFENRMRFCKEIITGIRKACGADFPISLRLTVDEFTDYGYHLDEGIRIAEYFDKLGVDLLNISNATYESLGTAIEPASYEQGWRTYLAEAVKKHVNAPVVTCGNIKEPAIAEEILRAEKADFVAIGRGHIADPEWCNKARMGKEHEIRRCISCLHCFEEIMNGHFVTCAVNPRKGREWQIGELKKDKQGQKAVVVGAGPGGIEAAITLAQRGYTVKLFDKEPRIGGQLNYAMVPPGKSKIGWFMEYGKTMLDKYHVMTILGREITKELILEEAPDLVIIATGAVPIIPNVPGINSDNVVTADDYLGKRISFTGMNVVVIGGGLTGCETAVKISADNNKVTVVDMMPEIMNDVFIMNKIDTLQKMESYNVSQMPNHRLKEITSSGVLLENIETKALVPVSSDVVVLALGVRPNNSLYDSLVGTINNLYVIGDANKSGRIANATANAYILSSLI